ncbi:hypothetical protein [Streptomyces sp. NPDC023838]|uniref:DUF6881 domain-containing protein n=1 Tax=Streptomyces sp. NPDC023838 TaxID=3154325 RepID=UPI0033C2872F
MQVRWDHEFAEEPAVIFSEIDDDCYEVRKVEVYRDGRSDWVDASRETDTIGLGEVPFPDLQEINSQEDFHAETITAAEFEVAWARARRTRRREFKDGLASDQVEVTRPQ